MFNLIITDENAPENVEFPNMISLTLSTYKEACKLGEHFVLQGYEISIVILKE